MSQVRTDISVEDKQFANYITTYLHNLCRSLTTFKSRVSTADPARNL